MGTLVGNELRSTIQQHLSDKSFCVTVHLRMWFLKSENPYNEDIYMYVLMYSQ